MNTTVEKLNKLRNTKEAIRIAINNKGGTLTETNKFSDYATAIDALTTGGGSVEFTKSIYAEQKDPVPNTGYVEKIFFNTSLSSDQVDSLIANAIANDNLTFVRGEYPILYTSKKIFTISSNSPGWLIYEIVSDTPYYASSVGWNQAAFTSFDSGEVVIDSDAISEMNGVAFGTQNNLLTELVCLYSRVDTGEIEIVKNLTDQYKLVEKNLKIDTGINTKYTYDFINNINDNTKEISIIKDIVINTKEDAIINKSVSTYTNNRLTAIGGYAFYGCSFLKEVSFPKATVIAQYAFAYDDRLTNIEIPLVTSIGAYAFYFCSEIVNIDIPSVTKIEEHAFDMCEYLKSINGPLVETIGVSTFTSCGLESVVLPKLTMAQQEAFAHNYYLKEADLSNIRAIYTGAFYRCYNLVKVFISQTNDVCALNNTDAFECCYHILGTYDETHNPNTLKDGYIYVPASKLSAYKTATNWSNFATQIIGHANLEAGASFPDINKGSFTTLTWYSDEKLTTVARSVTTSGTYYCRLEA